jgi:hypothetical protein
MEMETDKLLDRIGGDNQYRGSLRDPDHRFIEELFIDQNRFDCDRAGEKSLHKRSALGDESSAEACEIAGSQMPIGIEPSIL